MIGGEDFKALFVEETKFYNRIVLGPILPAAVWDPLPHFLQTWLRNYVAAVLLYFVSGLAWSFVIYYWKRNLYVPKALHFIPLMVYSKLHRTPYRCFWSLQHFTSHMVLFFVEGLWTANIHDCIHGKLWPVMGAGYHTIHHTTYRHNYGHYTIFMDWLFGTLRTPAVGDEDEPKIS